MNSQLSDIQKVLLDTFKAFSKFCKENNIQYFAAYGTLLGAIRHKGFIPWDDDMDVYMTRENYDKFISIKSDLASTSTYKIADYHDKGYPYDIAKFYDTTKTFWEYPQFRFIIGPFIDVFPLDSWEPNNIKVANFYDEQHAAFWKYRKSISYQSWKEILKDFVHLNGFDGPVKLVKKIIYNPQYKSLYNKLDNIESEMRKIEGKYYKAFSDIKSKCYDKSWFSEALYLDFEDTEIPVPIEYDKCLTVDYGDYMTPPKEHARTGHHTAFYMNLKEKLSIEDILREKSKELEPKRRLTFRILWDELKHRKGFK